MSILNTTLTFVIGPLLDDAGVAITGATWTAISALKPDGTTFTPIYTDKGNGVYWAKTANTQQGVWSLYSQAIVSSLQYDDMSVVTAEDLGRAQRTGRQ